MARKKSLLSRILHKSPFRPKTSPDAPDPLYPPPLPCLAFVRPRPLSAGTLDFSGSAHSEFFNKLPTDIRLKILRFAFGYSGIHVELDFDHPRLTMRSPGVAVDGREVDTRLPYILDNRSCPDPEDIGYCWARELARVDKHQPKQWRWWSGICTRNGSVFDGPRDYHPLALSSGWRYSVDTCKSRDTMIWEPKRWEFGSWAEPTKIGILGWLLCCRKAYSEGVRALYSANSFIMTNPELILNLPRLLLPSRLATITSLEMVWKVHPFRPQEPDDSILTDYDTLLRLTDATPKTFPSLIHLWISLQGDMYTDPERRTDKDYNFSDEAYEKVENLVIKPIESMLTRFDNLKIVVISLPSSCYGPRKQRAMDSGVEVFESRFDKGETLWRDVPEIPTKGYWIRLGHRDMGGGDYIRWACHMGGNTPPPGPFSCLYGDSMSPW